MFEVLSFSQDLKVQKCGQHPAQRPVLRRRSFLQLLLPVKRLAGDEIVYIDYIKARASQINEKECAGEES